MMEIKEAGSDNRRLRNIAKKLIEKAEAGDLQAMAMLFDRTDGKPMQQTEISGPDGEELKFSAITFRIIDAKAKE